jgi:hypothetical protein
MNGPDENDRRQQDTEQQRYEEEAGWLASDPEYIKWLQSYEERT